MRREAEKLAGVGQPDEVTEGKPEVLTAAEVREILRCSRNMVYRLVARGAIPHHRLGRKIIFPRLAFYAWLNIGREVEKGDVKL